jgi:hypothetical protein
MSFWKDWSDGKKWFMGIVGAIVVALLLTGISRRVENNAISRRETSTPTNGKNDSPDNNKTRVFFTVEQLSGDWLMEYFVPNGPARLRARLDVNSKVWLNNAIVFCDPSVSSCANSWKLNDDGTVYMIFQTKIRADTGRFDTADPYRIVTCNLQPDQGGKTLEGSCIDDVGKGALRLSR